MNLIPQDLPGEMVFSPAGDGSARRLFPFKFSMDSLGTPFSSERVSATPRRLNLLFSATWREGGPTAELPRLLDPLGVRCLEARCGRDAARLVEQEEIHIALIDLELPMEANGDKRAAGEKVLQLLRRVKPTPPVVLVRPAQPSRRESVRGLSDALREGVFAVLDRPLGIETMLETLRRVVRRHYSDQWPVA